MVISDGWVGSFNINKKLVDKTKNLYLMGYSCLEIRERLLKEDNFSVCSETIRKLLYKERITLRNIKDAVTVHYRKKQPVSEILELYNKHKSVREISRELKISRECIRKILKEGGAEIKESRNALIAMGHIKEKKKFNLGNKEKAYLFGLVKGDLTPVKKSNYTLKLITHTTHPLFVDLLYATFSKYGISSCKETKSGNCLRFQTHVDLESFSFLLDSKKDKLPKWVNNKHFFDFLAGVIDSDGSVIINKASTNVKCAIRFFGQNKRLLDEVRHRLDSFGYVSSLSRTHLKGMSNYHRGVKFTYNKDYYTLEIYRKNEVLRFLRKIHLRHPEKIQKKNLAIKIINHNVVKWEDAKDEIIRLRFLIKQSVITRKSLNLSNPLHNRLALAQQQV